MSNNFDIKLPINIKIQISEPWDFDIGSGEIHFLGVLLKKIIGEDNQDYYIVKIIKPFEWKQNKIDYITVTPSFKGHKISDISKEETIVGIGFIKDKTVLNSERFLFNQVEYFAIGSISLVKK